MTELPKNGVRMVAFLTEVDFNTIRKVLNESKIKALIFIESQLSILLTFNNIYSENIISVKMMLIFCILSEI